MRLAEISMWWQSPITLATLSRRRPPFCIYKSRENAAAAAPLSVLTSSRSTGSSIPGGKIEVSSSLRVINNRYIIGASVEGGERARGGGSEGWRGDEGGQVGKRRRALVDARGMLQLISASRKEGGERGDGGGGRGRERSREGVPIYTSILNLLRWA